MQIIKQNRLPIFFILMLVSLLHMQRTVNHNKHKFIRLSKEFWIQFEEKPNPKLKIEYSSQNQQSYKAEVQQLYQLQEQSLL